MFIHIHYIKEFSFHRIEQYIICSSTEGHKPLRYNVRSRVTHVLHQYTKSLLSGLQLDADLTQNAHQLKRV